MRQALDEGVRQAGRWEQAWAGVFALGLAGGLVQLERAGDSQERYTARVGAAKSALALVDLGRSPQPHRRAREEFHLLATVGDERARQRADALLTDLAHTERMQGGWRERLGPLAVNLLAGLAIAFDNDRPGEGLYSFASGMLVTELQIRTRPDSASRHRDGYRRVTLRSGNARLDMEYGWALSTTGVGVVVRY